MGQNALVCRTFFFLVSISLLCSQMESGCRPLLLQPFFCLAQFCWLAAVLTVVFSRPVTLDGGFPMHLSKARSRLEKKKKTSLLSPKFGICFSNHLCTNCCWMPSAHKAVCTASPQTQPCLLNLHH